METSVRCVHPFFQADRRERRKEPGYARLDGNKYLPLVFALGRSHPNGLKDRLREYFKLIREETGCNGPQ